MIKLFVASLLASLLLLSASQSIVVNLGCKTYSKDGLQCSVCSERYYMDGNGICQKVSADCKTYSPDTGACLTCYGGYFLADVICVFGTSPGLTAGQADPYCVKIVNQTCTKCAKGFYLLQQVCNIIDPLCKTFDLTKLLCTECYSGFTLNSKAECDFQRDAPSPLVVGCSQLKESVCVKCSKGYYFDSNGRCVQVSSKCKSYEENNGSCLSCYSGYVLSSGSCLVDNSTTTYNPYCAKFQNSSCVSCSKGYYFDSSRLCQQVDPFCKVFDYSRLACTTCFSGFTLASGSCQVAPEAGVASDINCRKFDANGLCLNCSNGYYFNSDKVCTMVDPSCKKFDYAQLVCVLCYGGFDLAGGECSLSSKASSLSTCAEWLDNVCVKCSRRSYFDFQGNCVQVSDSCNSYNSFSGKCTSCYPGHALDSKGECNPSDSKSTCAEADKKTGACVRCFNGSYLSASAQCLPIDPFCSSFNYQTYLCSSCYKGYAVGKDGACTQQAATVANAIQNCVEYDSNQNCIKCYNMYYLSGNTCYDVNPLCKTYDSTNGNCLSCYSYFALSNGTCILK